MKLKIAVICLLINGLHAAEHIALKKQKMEIEFPHLVRIIDSRGERQQIRTSTFKDKCLRASVLAQIAHDPDVAKKTFKLPVTFHELRLFAAFCSTGGDIPQFKSIWGKNPMLGLSILERLGYDPVKNHGLPVHQLIFNFPGLKQKVSISGDLLYKIFLNSYGSVAFEQWYKQYAFKQSDTVTIPDAYQYILHNPEAELPLLLQLATARDANFLGLLKTQVIQEKYSDDKFHLTMKNMAIFSQYYLKLLPLSKFLSQVSQGISILKDLQGLNEKEAFNYLVRFMHPQDVVLYKNSLVNLANSLHFAIKVAPWLNLNDSADLLEDMMEKIRPLRPCEICTSVDDKMLFVHLSLLLKYKNLPSERERWHEHLTELISYLLIWSQHLTKEHPEKKRIYFEKILFEQLMQDLKEMGLSELDRANLQDKIRISEEAEIDVHALAEEIMQDPEMRAYYDLPELPEQAAEAESEFEEEKF